MREKGSRPMWIKINEMMWYVIDAERFSNFCLILQHAVMFVNDYD